LTTPVSKLDDVKLPLVSQGADEFVQGGAETEVVIPVGPTTPVPETDNVSDADDSGISVGPELDGVEEVLDQG